MASCAVLIFEIGGVQSQQVLSEGSLGKICLDNVSQSKLPF